MSQTSIVTLQLWQLHSIAPSRSRQFFSMPACLLRSCLCSLFGSSASPHARDTVSTYTTTWKWHETLWSSEHRELWTVLATVAIWMCSKGCLPYFCFDSDMHLQVLEGLKNTLACRMAPSNGRAAGLPARRASELHLGPALKLRDEAQKIGKHICLVAPALLSTSLPGRSLVAG